MGEEIHRQFPFIDFVCRGESDESFPRLVDALAGDASVGEIPGLVYRDPAGATVTGPPARPVTDADTLQVPDYSDYFRAIGDDDAFRQVVPTLLMETSRGCWWGAKSHCTFCGLNGTGMGFRSKSADRALAELQQLTALWPSALVSMVDNILDMSYFRDFLPALSRLPRRPRLFYETKSNLKREQVAQLRAAGVLNIQPGIESLSDRLLRLMGKGTSGLRNVQLLKWCREYGVDVDWNLLHGFPGETDADYAEIEQWLPLIRHLEPPSASGPIRLDRFSPYHSDPERYGITAVRPMAVYRHLYPFDVRARTRIAGYFDFDYRESADPGDAASRTLV